MTETLLINFLFLLIPVTLYLIFFENKANVYNYKIILFLLSSITMILCMTYPIKMEFGNIFDLRYIPFIIASLFGGYIIAAPLYLILNIYRFILGGEGIFLFLSFIFSTFTVLFVPLLKRKFIRAQPHIRVLIVGCIVFIIMGTYVIMLSSFFVSLDRNFWIYAVNIISTNVIGSIVIMLLIEKININIKTREKMIDSDRLSVVSELSASISHEIRNPLTVTSGFLQLLNKSQNVNEEEKKYIYYSLEELKRAEKIVSDFLSLAKPQAKNMVYSNLKDEVEYVQNIMVPYANNHHVELQLSFSNELCKCYDKNQMTQSLVNLYKNGIESMKNKGGILKVQVIGEKNTITIIVNDTGVGMSNEDLARLGKPYYSTKEGGTGLGMMIVYSTIHKLGGKIKVYSLLQKGTSFHITIPIKKSDVNKRPNDILP
ncbi:ATP-binding protein [Evansella sp. AB-rgal1]|uniref:ATP-binding protein n=1 Tax=Evansella sp. AB-rgal1 TaxID=3242696 RepID=UPI00359D8A97